MLTSFGNGLNLLRAIFQNPPRLLVVSFALTIGLGTLCLLWPGAAATGTSSLTWVEALFTSTSAVCVTGLIVRDPGSQFSFSGQLLILILIQLGGLGILTFSNLIILLRMGRFGQSQRMLIEETHGRLPKVTPPRLVGRILLYTATFEGIGAAVLTARFSQDYPFAKALWLGIFHAVSAFCNAGFCLFSNSLMDYRHDPVINVTVMTLIVLGGLGFVVLADLTDWLWRRRSKPRRRLTLHSRVVLWTSLWLILGGAIIVYLLEVTGQSLLHPPEALIVPSLFLSVTARTAGFNTLNTAELTNATLLVVIFMMSIGASPGSTAGGIKTTTFATLLSLLRSRYRNRARAEIFERSIPTEIVAKALATTFAFFVAAMLAVVLLQVTELAGIPHTEVRGELLEHLFEVVSALGTVGLSTGITSTLSGEGKLVIVVCMFLGRLGPVLVAASLIGARKRQQYTYPEDRLIVG